MVRLKWRWYDLWVGAYLDASMSSGTLYVCPLPTVVVEVALW